MERLSAARRTGIGQAHCRWMAPRVKRLLEMADGDGRAARMLNLIEQVAAWTVEGKIEHGDAVDPPDAVARRNTTKVAMPITI